MNFFRLLFIPVLLMLCTCLQAQHERDNWYFGDKAALNFPNSGTPVELPATSNLAYNPRSEAYTTVSHKTTGQLLFYTDGVRVWNRNHQQMAGDTLLYATKCLQVLCIPAPFDTSQYYIFTLNAKGATHELRYALVDMSLNGGLGKVTGVNNLATQYTQNLFTIAKHGTASAYWVITFRGSSGNDTFDCYPVTTAGVQPPVRSVMGTSKGNAGIGGLATNHAGDKIALISYATTPASISIHTFSKNCGFVGYPKELSMPPQTLYPRDPTFSANDNNLYVIFNNNTSQVMQYSGTDFQNISPVANSSAANPFMDMEEGPDGNIYIGTYGNQNGTMKGNRIDALEQPNLDAFSVVYKSNAITLSTTINNLPSFVTDNSVPGNAPATPVIDVKNTCLLDTTLFTPSNMPFLDSLLWDFGDTASKTKNTSAKDIPTHIFSDTGNYKVTLSWFSCGIKQSAFKQVRIITVSSINLGKDSTLCAGNKITLKGLQNVQLTWSTGSTDSAVTVTQPGTYWLEARVGPRCVSRDTIVISYYPELKVDFFEGEHLICEDIGETADLAAGEGFAKYNWLPGNDTGKTITVGQTGWYKVTVTNNKGCTASDSVLVGSQCDNTFYVPTAFTPNGDGLNDVFLPVFTDIFNYRLQIYNRWGEKVFETTDPKRGWDGTFKGKAVEGGLYMWRIFHQGNLQKIVRNYNYKGTVCVIE